MDAIRDNYSWKKNERKNWFYSNQRKSSQPTRYEQILTELQENTPRISSSFSDDHIHDDLIHRTALTRGSLDAGVCSRP